MRARPAPAALLLVVVALLAMPSLASASSLTRSGGVYTYTGSSGNNSITLNFGVGSFTVSDTENITMAGDGSCTGENGPSISCTVTATSIDFDMGAGLDGAQVNNVGVQGTIPITGQGGTGDDSINVTSSFATGAATTATLSDTDGNDSLTLNVTGTGVSSTFGYGTVNGGPGNDSVRGTGTVNGDAGNDTLSGFNPGSGSVTLNGGTENDTFPIYESHPEVANGGSGTDTVDYRQASNVTLSLDGAANDGPTGSQVDNANGDFSVEIVRTGGNTDNITGGTGSEQFFAGAGDDVINGGGGDDIMDGESGADTYIGGGNGAGGDTVTYESRSATVRVSPDGISANDGEANELDNIAADVENILGGFENDYILGNSGNNSFNGGPGDDQLEGGDGNDTLTGGFGQDKLEGGANNDTLHGNGGDDTLDGGNDTDTINGGGGADLLDGSGGTDTLNGENGSDRLLTRDNLADTANCGNGTDHSVHDAAGDTINADCEISDTGAAGFDQAVTREVVRETTVVNSPVVDDGKQAVVTCAVTRARRAGVRVKCRV
ncbi:MAG: hypothetical protein M3389_08550, partial [Actinomycetota bacterium]|nr:hypothetical protein [Actinomycetota bacterium]